MEKPFVLYLLLFILPLSTFAQNRYGLVLANGNVLHAKDTISLSYPSENAIIICEVFDENNTVIGKIGVQWSISGNLTILDTPIVSSQILIDASMAQNDQRGYLSAQASDPGVQWINSKVFIKIKGKNSHVLHNNIIFPVIQNHHFGKCDIAGRLQTAKGLFPSSVVIFHDALKQKTKKVIIVK